MTSCTLGSYGAAFNMAILSLIINFFLSIVEILSKKTVIHLEETSHKFAILDISQRLNYDKFVAFSRALGVPDRLIEDIKGANDLHQEQFYHVLKSWIMQDTEKATFSQLIKCLKLCKEDHLIQYLIQRLKH